MRYHLNFNFIIFVKEKRSSYQFHPKCGGLERNLLTNVSLSFFLPNVFPCDVIVQEKRWRGEEEVSSLLISQEPGVKSAKSPSWLWQLSLYAHLQFPRYFWLQSVRYDNTKQDEGNILLVLQKASPNDDDLNRRSSSQWKTSCTKSQWNLQLVTITAFCVTGQNICLTAIQSQHRLARNLLWVLDKQFPK